MKTRIVNVGNVPIGGGDTVLIAGPCTIESEEQICTIAELVKSSGAKILRGGAFKPRTNADSFQGLHEQGLEFLSIAKAKTGLPTVSEITDASLLPLFEDVDLLQVGARNMQNYELLKALGRQNKPVLLKRGFAATYDELLSASEYIKKGGNENIILCERGIRTFEPYTRYTFDISAIPALKSMAEYPIIADPSHAAGRYDMIKPLCLASTAAGADGIMTEVHYAPESAVCDGRQSVKPNLFGEIAGQVLEISALRRVNESNSKSEDFGELRKMIDEADRELASVFAKRLDIVKQIGQIKRMKNLPVTDSERENEILSKMDDNLKRLYRTIFEISKDNE